MSKPLNFSKSVPSPTAKAVVPKSVSLADIRTAVMNLAGVDEEFLATQLRAKLQKLDELTEASTTQYFANLGQVTDKRVKADNTTQLKATTEYLNTLKDLAALRSRVQAEEPAIQDTTIVVNVGWLQNLRQPDSESSQDAPFDVTPDSTVHTSDAP